MEKNDRLGDVSMLSSRDKKTVIDMAGYEEEGNIDKFLDDLYETAKLDELMDKERQVPIERYEALRREQSVVTERHIISDVDPYTKKKIRTPLRNVHCGHVYDKEGVMALLQQCGAPDHRRPCAVQGCENADIKMEDMKDYLEFFALLHSA
uniref:E3 SUMO-protein ligase NSE2 n=1 Tax=Parascaris equorum TaxID=6256 RepID=A0A914RQP0_PAREQ